MSPASIAASSRIDDRRTHPDRGVTCLVAASALTGVMSSRKPRPGPAIGKIRIANRRGTLELG
jgi:hypothetical protein